jgi:outer membrane receptor for ferrienterochelin and colicins
VELRAFGYTTHTAALTAVRGLFVSDDRTYTFLGVRGFAPPGDFNTRLLILWDGHPLNDVVTGQGYAARDLAVDLEEVERIEVVRGPGSALYGTGALFGVINVVPRDSLGPNAHVEAEAGVGSLGTTRLRVTTGWREGDRAALLSGAWMKAVGAETTRLGHGLPTVEGLDGERAATVSLRARAGGLSLQARLHGRSKETPVGPFGTQLGAAGTRSTDVRGFAELRYERELGEGMNLFVRGAYDASDYRGHWMYAQPEDGSPREETDAARADWLSAETRLRMRLPGGHQLTMGLEGQGQLRVEQEAFGPLGTEPIASRSRGLISAYLLDEWRAHPRLSLSAGLRLDRYFNLDTLPLTPRLALIVHPYARGLTKLVGGRAFRAPTPFELDYRDNGRTHEAAGTLAPESISTLELEHTHEFTDELRLSLAGYYNLITDLVILSPEAGPARCGNPTGSVRCVVFTNRPGQTRALGAEAGLRWQPGRYLLVDLNYSFVALLNATQEEADNAPTHLASGRLLLPLGDGTLRLSTQATYQSARGQRGRGSAQGEALLLDLGLSGELPHLRYFAGVRNLLDSQYALALGEERAAAPVPQYGRTFTLQLTASF